MGLSTRHPEERLLQRGRWTQGTPMSKKLRIAAGAGSATVAVVLGCWLLVPMATGFAGLAPPIKVGVLHSLTGTMAISERSVVDASLLAIEEINESGGLLGRTIEAVVADGGSDPPTFAREAERLIVTEEVSVVFGCWTSASRKVVKPLFEEHDHLLVYPVQYEGLEQSPNIIYTGAAPNQQIIPAVKWTAENLGMKFFLVGSDYVFPRAANAIIRDQVGALGAEIVGEEYILLGSGDVSAIVQHIVETQPDVILNTLNGDSNVAFFEALRRAGVDSRDVPTMSFSVGEAEIASIGADLMVGDYACWNYFDSLQSAENQRFIAAFQSEYGADRVTNDPMEAAYVGVHLWSRAVVVAGSADPDRVLESLHGQTYSAPEGAVFVDLDNNHLWKHVHIGQILGNGRFDIQWSSGRAIQPSPYPRSRPRREWDRYLDELYRGWGEQWSNPGN